MNSTALLWFRISVNPMGRDDYVTVVRARDHWSARLYAHELVQRMKHDTLTTLVNVEPWEKMNRMNAA